MEDIAASRIHQHLVPGSGAIDFAAVFDALGAVGYAGWVTVELYPYIDDPDGAARAAYDYVRHVAAGRDMSQNGSLTGRGSPPAADRPSDTRRSAP
jgi:hypothetical protein